MKELYSIPGCRVERVTRRSQAAAVVVARPEGGGARCPSCKTLSDTPHGTGVGQRLGFRVCGETETKLEMRHD